MLIIGADYLTSLLTENHFSAKMVFNSNGALIFPTSQEHRDQKAAGISYEDEYQGNALAAVLSSGRIEVRKHQGFSDARVADIISLMLAQPELYCMNGWAVVYQGRDIVRRSKE